MELLLDAIWGLDFDEWIPDGSADEYDRNNNGLILEGGW